MKIIGVTGGVGAGKSTVLEILKTDYGAAVLEMDAVGRQLMEPGGTCFASVLDAFGADMLKSDGSLDRKKLADLVFHNEEERKRLNGIIHPAVAGEIKKRLEELRREGRPFAVLESAILLEAGYGSICQEVWYVRADPEIRIRRLRESRGYSREKSLSVIDSQKSDREFLDACDIILDNSGTKKELKEQIARILSL